MRVSLWCSSSTSSPSWFPPVSPYREPCRPRHPCPSTTAYWRPHNRTAQGTHANISARASRVYCQIMSEVLEKRYSFTTVCNWVILTWNLMNKIICLGSSDIKHWCIYLFNYCIISYPFSFLFVLLVIFRIDLSLMLYCCFYANSADYLNTWFNLLLLMIRNIALLQVASIAMFPSTFFCEFWDVFVDVLMNFEIKTLNANPKMHIKS